MRRKQLSKKEREAVYSKYLGHCAYCGSKIEYKDMQVDHFAPVYLFGDNTNISNLMPACRQCNFRKGTFTLEKFRKELETTCDRLRRDNFMFRLAEKYKIVECSTKPVEFFFEKIDRFVRNTKDLEIVEMSVQEIEQWSELYNEDKDKFLDWYEHRKTELKA